MFYEKGYLLHVLTPSTYSDRILANTLCSIFNQSDEIKDMIYIQRVDDYGRAKFNSHQTRIMSVLKTICEEKNICYIDGEAELNKVIQSLKINGGRKINGI